VATLAKQKGIPNHQARQGIQAAKDPPIGQLYAETGEPVWFAL